MADGKVIIDTELDNSGVVKSSNTLKQALNNLANTMKGPFERNTSRAFLSARQKVRETEIAIQAVEDEMRQIESGSKRAGDSAYKAFDKAKQKVEENRIAMGALEEKMREISLQKTADLSDFYKDPGQLDNAVGEALSKDKEFLKLGAQFDKVLTISFTENHSSMGLTLRFGGDTWPSQIDVEWKSGQGNTILQRRYFPIAMTFYLDGKVENYRQIVLRFVGTAKPYRYLKLTEIKYGLKRIFSGRISPVQKYWKKRTPSRQSWGSIR